MAWGPSKDPAAYRGHPRRGLLLVGLVPVVAAVAIYWVSRDSIEAEATKATVPGIGHVDGYLLPGTEVQPPASPAPRRYPTRTEQRTARRVDDEVFMRTNEFGGRDVGEPAVIAQVKRDALTRLFLSDAAVGCLHPPVTAALAVINYAYVDPARQERAGYVLGRKAYEYPQECARQRTVIEHWDSVHVNGTTAEAKLSMRHEGVVISASSDHRWDTRLQMQRTADGWKISADPANDLDYQD